MKRFLKQILFTLFIFIIVLKLGCVDLPTDLTAPKWDVDLNVPIINHSYSLSDIITTKDYISSAGTSNGDSVFLLESDSYSQEVNVSKFVQLTKPTILNNLVLAANNSQYDTVYIPFPENAELDSASFTDGKFALYIDNPTSSNVTLDLLCPGVYDPNGTQLRVRRIAYSNRKDSVINDLSGYNYVVPANQININKNSLQIILKATSNSNLAYVNLNLKLYEFYFNSVSGIIPPKSLGNNSDSFNLKLGDAKDFRDKVSLQNAKLFLNVDYVSNITNPFGFEVKNLNIIGEREDGTKFYLKDSTGNSNLDLKINSKTYQKVFTEKNSNINNFIAFLPAKVYLNANYEMNPDNQHGKATSKDSIKFSAHFSATSYLSLKALTITDTTSINAISPDERDKIKDAKSVNLTVTSDNGIPLASYLKVTMADKNYRPLFTIKNSADNSDSIYFPGAPIDQNGTAYKTSATTAVVQLDSANINDFADAYYAIFDVSVHTKNASQTPPPIVVIRPNDKIKVLVTGQVKYRVNN
jgi:hypothetical protein